MIARFGMCCRHDMASSDDDVWGDGEEAAGEGGREAMDREWQARREEHYSSGYREGVEAGKHDTVQEGFNQGASTRHAPACRRLLA